MLARRQSVPAGSHQIGEIEVVHEEDASVLARLGEDFGVAEPAARQLRNVNRLVPL